MQDICYKTPMKRSFKPKGVMAHGLTATALGCPVSEKNFPNHHKVQRQDPNTAELTAKGITAFLFITSFCSNTS